MLTRFVRSAVVAVATLVAASAAYAAPIIGGDTYLRLDIGPAFTSAGGTVGTVGTATYLGTYNNAPVYDLPITGGNDAPPVTVEHIGSGLSFTFGGQTLTIGNFVIDGTALTIFGDGSFGGTTFNDQALFSVMGTSDPDFPLLLSTTATSAAALKALTGADVPVSIQVAAAGLFGVQTAVPEPGTWLLMVGGFGLVGGALRRRSSSTAVA